MSRPKRCAAYGLQAMMSVVYNAMSLTAICLSLPMSATGRLWPVTPPYGIFALLTRHAEPTVCSVSIPTCADPTPRQNDFSVTPFHMYDPQTRP